MRNILAKIQYSPEAYLIMRIYVVSCALFLIVFGYLVGFTTILHFDEIYPFDPPPSPIWQDSLPWFGIAILLIFPNRWTLKKPLYYLRMAILIIGLIAVLRLSYLGISSFILHDKDPIIFVGIIGAIILGISAPLSLYMKKSQFSSCDREAPKSSNRSVGS